jgi:hypothetical protein
MSADAPAHITKMELSQATFLNLMSLEDECKNELL